MERPRPRRGRKLGAFSAVMTWSPWARGPGRGRAASAAAPACSRRRCRCSPRSLDPSQIAHRAFSGSGVAFMGQLTPRYDFSLPSRERWTYRTLKIDASFFAGRHEPADVVPDLELVEVGAALWRPRRRFGGALAVLAEGVVVVLGVEGLRRHGGPLARHGIATAAEVPCAVCLAPTLTPAGGSRGLRGSGASAVTFSVRRCSGRCALPLVSADGHEGP